MRSYGVKACIYHKASTTHSSEFHRRTSQLTHFGTEFRSYWLSSAVNIQSSVAIQSIIPVEQMFKSRSCMCVTNVISREWNSSLVLSFEVSQLEIGMQAAVFVLRQILMIHSIP